MIPKPKRKADSSMLAMVRKEPCAACGTTREVDAAHIRSKGAGGGDDYWNLLALCRTHHQKQHAVGWFDFAGMSLGVTVALKQRGWVFSDRRLRRQEEV